MLPLDKDLQKPKNTLKEFYCIAKRVKEYMPNVLSHSVDKNDYTIFVSEMASTKKYIRPINKTIYIDNHEEFESSYALFKETLYK